MKSGGLASLPAERAFDYPVGIGRPRTWICGRGYPGQDVKAATNQSLGLPALSGP